MGGESGGERPHAETAPGPVLAAGDGVVPVVGIGASAGGPGAFQEFLRSVPSRSGCVLLVDHHGLLRQGLASLLTAEPDLVVAGGAESGEAAIEATRSLRSDVIRMDVTMPGLSGVEGTRRVVTEDPSARVLGLSMHESSTMETTMREAGAVGYVTKTSAAEVLVARLREVMRIPTPALPGADGPSPEGVPPDSP